VKPIVKARTAIPCVDQRGSAAAGKPGSGAARRGFDRRQQPCRALLGERHFDELPQDHLVRVAKGRHADADLVLRDVEPERSVQPVPERQPARPVRIRLLLDDRVVDAVHAGRDDQRHEAALQPERQAQVGMVEEDADEQEGLPDRQRPRRHADEGHLRRAIRHRRRHLGEVEAQGGRGVHVEVDVMHLVQAPQHG
jgi:hypothetical protein